MNFKKQRESRENETQKLIIEHSLILKILLLIHFQNTLRHLAIHHTVSNSFYSISLSMASDSEWSDL